MNLKKKNDFQPKLLIFASKKNGSQKLWVHTSGTKKNISKETSSMYVKSFYIINILCLREYWKFYPFCVVGGVGRFRQKQPKTAKFLKRSFKHNISARSMFQQIIIIKIFYILIILLKKISYFLCTHKAHFLTHKYWVLTLKKTAKTSKFYILQFCACCVHDTQHFFWEINRVIIYKKICNIIFSLNAVFWTHDIKNSDWNLDIGGKNVISR